MFTAQFIQTSGNSAINGDATENISVVLSLATRGEDGAASLTSAIVGQSVQALLTYGQWDGRFLPRPSRQHDLLMSKVVICFCCVDNKLTELIFNFFCLYNDNFPSDLNSKAILKLFDYTIILTIILTDLEFWLILLPVLLGEFMHWFHFWCLEPHTPSTKEQTQKHGTVGKLQPLNPFCLLIFLFEDSLRASNTVPLPNNGSNSQERGRNRMPEGERKGNRQTDLNLEVHPQSLELEVRGVGNQRLGQVRLSQVREWELAKIPGWPRRYCSG